MSPNIPLPYGISKTVYPHNTGYNPKEDLPPFWKTWNKSKPKEGICLVNCEVPANTKEKLGHVSMYNYGGGGWCLMRKALKRTTHWRV
jgi:hypothetical protein